MVLYGAPPSAALSLCRRSPQPLALLGSKRGSIRKTRGPDMALACAVSETAFVFLFDGEALDR